MSTKYIYVDVHFPNSRALFCSLTAWFCLLPKNRSSHSSQVFKKVAQRLVFSAPSGSHRNTDKFGFLPSLQLGKKLQVPRFFSSDEMSQCCAETYLCMYRCVGTWPLFIFSLCKNAYPIDISINHLLIHVFMRACFPQAPRVCKVQNMHIYIYMHIFMCMYKSIFAIRRVKRALCFGQETSF